MFFLGARYFTLKKEEYPQTLPFYLAVALLKQAINISHAVFFHKSFHFIHQNRRPDGDGFPLV